MYRVFDKAAVVIFEGRTSSSSTRPLRVCAHALHALLALAALHHVFLHAFGGPPGWHLSWYHSMHQPRPWTRLHSSFDAFAARDLHFYVVRDAFALREIHSDVG